MPVVNKGPPGGGALPATKLNAPGPPILLLAVAALKLNPPGAGAVNQNKNDKS